MRSLLIRRCLLLPFHRATAVKRENLERQRKVLELLPGGLESKSKGDFSPAGPKANQKGAMPL